VAAILQDSEGRILICERSDFNEAWQFPQGGIEPGESRREALHREVLEEIGLRPADYRVIRRRGPFRYRLARGAIKNGFRGQSHHYFLLRLTSPRSAIRCSGHDSEFRRVRWILPEAFRLDWLPLNKRAAYGRALHALLGIVVK